MRQPKEKSASVRRKSSRLFESLVPKRTPGWTSAYGTAIVVRAIRDDAKLEAPCNAVLQGEYGLGNLSTTVPVILGKEGIESVQVLKLTPEEQEELENCARTLRPHMQMVEDFIK